MVKIGLFSEDRALQPLLAAALGTGFEVTLAPDEAALQRLANLRTVDAILIDLNGSHRSAAHTFQCCSRLLGNQPVAPMIIMTDDALRSSAAELVRLGAFGFLRRPPSIPELKAMLLRAQETIPAISTHTHESCDRLIGSSPAMQHVYELIRSVAPVHASVLITGDSGTGKELIARAIHNLGPQCSQPFVALSCGAIPETLIEAELFGHEKGAFTGSVGARVGYLEQAREGTLLLDEIGDLSLATQVKLLRVLQQREFSRLGSNQLIPLRARLIFATHRDLGDMVAQGTFRQDLYYRINVVRIHAPCLEERRADISTLATHFLQEYSAAYCKTIHSIDDDALAALETYSWPGNVRELENIMQRTIIMARTGSIRLADLPQHIRGESVISIDEVRPTGSFERQLRDYKVKLASAAVREHNGNKTLAARSLQISRAYLHRLLRASGSEAALDTDIPRLELA